MPADVAPAKGANFAPRLADALPAGKPEPGRPSSVDKVYAVTNFQQASWPAGQHLRVGPVPDGFDEPRHRFQPAVANGQGHLAAGRTPQTLMSEEAVLAAADSGAIVLEPTRVVLNCPIVDRGAKGALPGVSLTQPPP